jgi:thiol-disulfide isomerase/thioredoxin
MEKKQEITQRFILVSRILLAILFLLSAVAKLYPSPHFALTTFEMKQLIPMGFSETSAAYFSRILIGCELALGILLLQRHYFKRLVLPMSFLILLIFSVHLTYEIIATGNSGNCGCFGALLPMTPLQAVIKNIIAMAIIGWVYWKSSVSEDRLNFSTLLSITFASILAVFLVGPMAQKTTGVKETIEEELLVTESPTGSVDTLVHERTSTTIIEADGKKVTTEVKEEIKDEPKPKKSGFKSYFADIDNGKKVLCFFAPGCDHCKETAKELTQLKKQIKGFPDIRIIFMDEEPEAIPDFFKFAGAEHPYYVMDIITFWKKLGSGKEVPGVLYLWNGNTQKFYQGIDKKEKE